jgi:hypothetical protein
LLTALHDGLSLWEAEALGNAATLSLIRLDANEKFLVPFTVSMARAQVHYVDASTVSGYFHGSGPDCLLCRAGLVKDVRDLWPAYDLVDRAVGVVAITPNMRPMSLRPQLMTILRQVKEASAPLLLSIKYERPKFLLSLSPLPEDADDGAEAIALFTTQLEQHQVDLGSVYPRYANEELASIAEIAARLTAKGIKAA